MRTVVKDETAPGRRWQKVGDPMAPGKMLGAPPAAELRDAGVTVTAHECDPDCPVVQPAAAALCGGSPR